MDEHRKLLFICTGNYYRSRYAELCFNARGGALAADWRAESRGFRLGPANVGPIAPCVLERLTARAVPHPPASRFPLQLHEQDLIGAARIIALDEDEHRPLARTLFPPWSGRIAYWRIPDLDRLGSEAALDAIEREVERLIQDLLQSGASAP